MPAAEAGQLLAVRKSMLKQLVLVAGLASACATAPKSRPATETSPARVRDSASERVAAQRAADPKIDRDAEESRWGTEQAAARKREEEAKRRAAQEAGGSGVDVKKAQH
jgi:hypothetical protein